MSAPARAGVPLTRGTSAVARAGSSTIPRPTRQPGVSRPPSRRALRLVPARPVGAPRTPFVLLVLSLLGAGLVVLLLLNAAAVANSDQQRRLRKDTAELKIREQQLRRTVSSMEAPGALAEHARKLGMVPSGDPAFLILLPDGTSRVAGDPQPAPSPAPSPASDGSSQSPSAPASSPPPSGQAGQAGAPGGGR